MAPALPADESDRLADLRELGVLDTGVDPDIDSLVDMAALIAGTRIALLSIVEEDEQVFKSSGGLDAARMPRAASHVAIWSSVGSDGLARDGMGASWETVGSPSHWRTMFMADECGRGVADVSPSRTAIQ